MKTASYTTKKPGPGSPRLRHIQQKKARAWFNKTESYTTKKGQGLVHQDCVIYNKKSQGPGSPRLRHIQQKSQGPGS